MRGSGVRRASAAEGPAPTRPPPNWLIERLSAEPSQPIWGRCPAEGPGATVGAKRRPRKLERSRRSGERSEAGRNPAMRADGEGAEGAAKPARSERGNLAFRARPIVGVADQMRDCCAKLRFATLGVLRDRRRSAPPRNETGFAIASAPLWHNPGGSRATIPSRRPVFSPVRMPPAAIPLSSPRTRQNRAPR